MGKLINHNGSPAISHGGKIYPPMMATICNVDNGKYIIDKEYLKNLGESGIKIYFLICDTEWIRPDAFDKLDEEVKILLEAVPDALIMLRIGLHPSDEWVRENMEECIKYSDGTYPICYLNTESYYHHMPGCYTLYSDKWRKEAGKWLIKTYNRLMEKPYADRITGVFFAAGSTSEWQQLGALKKVHDGIYADYSEAMKREFSLYLREKYKTVENLRKAWRDETASFDELRVPEADKWFYALDMRYDEWGVDYVVKHRNRRDGQKATGKSMYKALDKDFYDNPNHIGSFLNVDNNMDVFDFFHARAAGTTRSLSYFGKLIKDISDDLLTGAFYGNYGATLFYNSVSTPYVYKLLKEGTIDIFSAPGVYQNRRKGGFEGQRCMYDSMRINGSMFVVEDDTRTHAEIPEIRQALDLYTAEDSINILKRNFGRNICDDLQGWWFDQHIGGGRYKFPEIYDLFKKQSEIASEAYSLNRDKGHEIAFIYDEESVHMVSPKTTHDTIEYMRNYEIARIGAGVDIYYHNDMSNPNMPDYKLYVFFNTYCLTDEERQAIRNKLSRNHATAVFMYAGGVINPDADNRFSEDNMSELLGMNIRMDREVRTPLFAVTAGHAATRGMDKGRSYGDLDRHINHSVIHIADWQIGNYERSYLCPCFYAEDDDAQVLGTFRETGLPALTLKELADYNVVHCGTKVVRAEVIRSLASYAGCHIYMDSDDVLFQNKNYVVIHASSSGTKRVKLPKKCSVREVYENKYYGNDTDTIECDMLLGETKMFRLV
ncbi:MAG: hypothetical protein IJ454_03000 [Clostridia bacterium]|nr:hypothetical protein [Clostridia bacterium]